MKKLIALEVPWQISPSISDIVCTIRESDGRGEAALSFWANVVEPLPPPLLESRGHRARAVECRVVCELLWCEMLNWRPAYSEREVLNPNEFDYALVNRPTLDIEMIDQWREKFFKEWHESAICPDPGAYKVECTQELNVPDGYELMVFTGRDIFIELIARGIKYSWTKASEFHE